MTPASVAPARVGPLADLGIVVTRPARRAALFAQKLEAMGARAIVVPAIVILPPESRDALDAAHANLARYDGVFFVSGSAVEYGAPAPGAWPGGVPAYAPGRATAAELIDAGIADARYPKGSQDSEGLLALPELAAVGGKRFLVLRGDGGRELLAATLRERGATVDVVGCYRRIAPQGLAEGLVALVARGAVQALTVTSSEAVGNLWAMLDEPTRARLRAIPTFAPHPRIAEAARALGLDAIVTAPGDMGIVAALLRHFAHAGAPRKETS
ncbi:MAG: uroporphyrinogen-III synthase [Proteobacteria bacterium]|nr:uroporphyrinogen-III synthase [Pseudomonadota bacterium]